MKYKIQEPQLQLIEITEPSYNHEIKICKKSMTILYKLQKESTQFIKHENQHDNEYNNIFKSEVYYIH